MLYPPWFQQYGEFLLEDHQAETVLSKATVGNTTSVVTGGAKLISESHECAHKAAEYVAKDGYASTNRFQQKPPSKLQQKMRNSFPKTAEFFDAWHQVLEEGKARDEGAHQLAASIPEALLAIGTGNTAAIGIATDNAVTGLWQILTNKPQSSLVTQGIAIIGDKTGLYNPSNAETLSAAFNLGVIGVASLPEKSKTMLNALDLATTTTNIRSKLSNIMFARSNALSNFETATNLATSSTAVLPQLTPQQAFNMGTGVGIAILGKAAKDTFDVLQKFSKHEEELSIPGFNPEKAKPTALVTPAQDLISSSSWFPAIVDKVQAYPGPVAEIKKPIIFSGEIDYADQELLDSLNELEQRNHVTPGMFDKIRAQVEWTGEKTFTWNGLEGRVKTTGNVEIEHTQVHHIIPLKELEPETYDFVTGTGFNLEDDANKMVLPDKKGAEISGMDSSTHQGRHDATYIKTIERQLEKVADTAKEQGWYDLPKEEFQAKCQQKIKEFVLEPTRDKLQSGDLPLNKLGSNKLNNGPKPEVVM